MSGKYTIEMRITDDTSSISRVVYQMVTIEVVKGQAEEIEIESVTVEEE